MDTHEQAGPEVITAEVVGAQTPWYARVRSAVTRVRIPAVTTILVAAVGIGIGILAAEAYRFSRVMNADKSTPEQE